MWKILMYLAKKWPEIVVNRPKTKVVSFLSRQSLLAANVWYTFFKNASLLLSFFKGRVDMLIRIIIKMSQGHYFLRKSVDRKKQVIFKSHLIFYTDTKIIPDSKRLEVNFLESGVWWNWLPFNGMFNAILFHQLTYIVFASCIPI